MASKLLSTANSYISSFDAPMLSLSDYVRRILLSLSLSDAEKQERISRFFVTKKVEGSESLVEVLAAVYELLQTQRLTHGVVCLFSLEEAFNAHPDKVSAFFTPTHVPGFFSDLDDDTDELRAGVFLWRILKYKHERSSGDYTGIGEAKRMLRILERRYDVESPRDIPPCCMRY